MKNSDEKGDMGQFFTPLKVVDEMINMIDIKENMKICDPACRGWKIFIRSYRRQNRRVLFNKRWKTFKESANSWI